ncbi:MAG: DUF3623 family protein [Alphaproteobacteria bacterium]|jgi:putative photosynthetic complex assembly protein 2|nr:DUF3623 family protein [Alphaproteobacteria bacterium]
MVADFAPPFLFTLFVWWFSTGAILWLVRRPGRQEAAIVASLTLVLGASCAGLIVLGPMDAPAAAYLSFLCGLGVWGFHEALFLMGVVTGPRPEPCPSGATGWRRFRYATMALLYHEIALAVTAVALLGLTWGQPNQAAALTFALLFVMRLSAKFNIFLGVPNLTVEFFPSRLEHLKSYLLKRPMNLLFPISVAGSFALLWALLAHVELAPTDSAAKTTALLLFALGALALLEHAFMILPLPEAALWRWAAPSTQTKNR